MILTALLKIDVKQFLDCKHNSKISDTVIIDTVSKVFTVHVIGFAVVVFLK